MAARRHCSPVADTERPTLPAPLSHRSAAFAWHPAAAAALWQQPAVSLSQGLALAAAQQQQPAPAGGIASGLWAPQAGELHELRADSVRRKRKRAMNKHKHRKRRKLQRMRK
jgi:hypothetical protein